MLTLLLLFHLMTLDDCFKLNYQTGVLLWYCVALLMQQLAQYKWQKKTGITVMQVNQWEVRT